MYQCERCGGTFASFKTAGQCPLCMVWASVRCSSCGHTAHANEFINNHDRCPKCGARVSVPGGSGSDTAGAIGCVILVVLGAIGFAIYLLFR